MPVKQRNFVLLVFGVIAISLIASHFDAKVLNLNPEKYSKKQNISKLNDVVQFIENVYVEDVKWDKAVEGAIGGMLETLDPHSAYFTAEDVVTNEENFEGKYQGIGIHFDVLDGYPTVISVIPGSPAEEVGLLAGDQFIKIDGESAYQMTVPDVPKKLKGPAGSSVDVTIKRNGSEESFDLTIIRREVPIFTLNTYFKADYKTGYIWVNRFARTTSSELEEAMVDLESQGIEQLILDLRGNGGGLLKEAVKVVSKFIPGHEKVVYTQGRFSRYTEDFYTDDFEVSKVRDYPLIVLIDGSAASASEIVAGAIQDYDRGLIVGMNSFGKGLVQNEFALNDESRIRLTVSRYYTPSGRLIQKPYKNKDINAYYNGDVQDLVEVDSTENDSLKDRPIHYTRNGREVLGGGGITPDVEVKFETISKARDLTWQLIQKRVFFEFASALVNNNPSWASEFNQFDKNFAATEENLMKLKNIAIQKGINIDNDEYKSDREYIQNRIKAEIARNIWGMSRYYQVILEFDNQFQKSLELFPQASKLRSLTANQIEQK